METGFIKGVTGPRWASGLMAACLVLAPPLLQAQAAAASAATVVGFRSPSSTPASPTVAAARAPLLAVTEAGRRLVAVGLRGTIVFSDDAGKTWTQAKVPVETDLVAVNFATPTQGWAVGHRGVVLESTDAGATWVRRFGDQQINELVLRYYEALKLAQAPAPSSAAAHAADAAARAIKDQSLPSLLDVWFDSPTSGTLVGTFNTVLRTEDGGKTWTPWMDRIDNPEELHFYAVRGGSAGLYLAGEKGGVWRLDDVAKRWVAVPTGYAGTLFGLVVQGPSVLAFGMRGSVFASADSGKTWQPVPTPRKAGLAAGLRLLNGDIVLADQAGGLIRSRDAGRSFAAVDGAAGLLAFSLAQGAEGQLFAAGPRGVAAVPLQ